MSDGRESVMERHHRVMAQSAEWFAHNHGRNDARMKQTWERCAAKHRKMADDEAELKLQK